MYAVMWSSKLPDTDVENVKPTGVVRKTTDDAIFDCFTMSQTHSLLFEEEIEMRPISDGYEFTTPSGALVKYFYTKVE